MPVNSNDLIKSVTNNYASASCEADWRGTCSRAYYAIYQDSEAFHNALPSPGRLTPESDGGMHADLIDRLIHPTIARSNPDCARSTSIGYMMQTVYANRIKSDYKREKIIDKAAAENSIELLLRIAEKLANQNAGAAPSTQSIGTPKSCQTPTPSTSKITSPAPQVSAKSRPILNRIK